MKTFSRCEESKSLDAFVKCTFTKSGYGPHCLECDRKRVAERRKDPVVRSQTIAYSLNYRSNNLGSIRSRDRETMRSKQAWVNSFKTGPCVDCLMIFPPCCMDFDHVRGSKFKGVGQLLGYSRERILREIAKCDLVCACCHRIRTKEQRWLTTSNSHRRKFHAKIAVLKDKPCLDCRGNFQPVAMDFDHIHSHTNP